MRIIGVTGGIGSGKSTVSAILSGFGAQIIDADLISRQIVQKGEKTLGKIAHEFGNGILQADGQLNRKALAALVFNDSPRLGQLNAIIHGDIGDRIASMAEKAREDDQCGILVVDAPIPIEHGFIDVVDEIWAVSADMETRIKRVVARSGLTYYEVVNRINSQISDEEYLKLADRIIYNNGTFEELKTKVLKLLD